MGLPVKPSVFGERLRFMRKKRGLSQAELGACAEMSSVMISRLEKGEARSTRFAKALADCLDVDVGWLLGGAQVSAESTVSVPIVRWEDLTTPIGRLSLLPTDIVPEDALEGDWFALVVAGSGMDPDFVAGDTLIVKRVRTSNEPQMAAETPQTDGYVVVQQDGGAVVRRRIRDGSVVWLAASPLLGPAQPVTPETRIAGVVRALYRRI
ncbi:LexA family transcriptional regulator [Acidiferrobacter sp.]|uniref:LexA family transcriptional regulator n=1 Tax=Acidiferrobacter sp. TaxID=1872107 RepID=UPI002639F6E4|nr:LexA family transcriptional regulator [Acidiferrobacter sp.]